VLRHLPIVHLSTKLKEDVADLKLKKKIDEEEIKQMVNMKEEKLKIEFKKKEMDLEAKKNEEVAIVKDEYRDKLETFLIKKSDDLKEMYGEILERLPNVNLKMKG